MAVITVKGKVATVTINDKSEDEADEYYTISCDRGAWCANVAETEDGQDTLADAMALAVLHVDVTEAPDRS
jgi:hypothetical protein